VAWKIVGGPDEYTASGVDPDTVHGWMYEIGSEDKRRMIRVELSALAVDESSIASDDIRRAISTRGRLAVEHFLGFCDQPPTRVVIGPQAISAPDDDADDLVAQSK
jgi:hypothetical protein